MVLPSKFGNLYPNYIKFRRMLQSYSFPKYVSSTATDCPPASNPHNPHSIVKTFQSTPETLRVQFQDSLMADFYYMWLRDNCHCRKCVHPKTKQKLIDTSSIDTRVTPLYHFVSEAGDLKMVWKGERGEHFSCYNSSWLHRYGLGFQSENYKEVHDCLPRVQCWNGKDLQGSLLEIGYEDLMQKTGAADACLQNIFELGLVVVRNVPNKTGHVVKAMNRIANVKNAKCESTLRVISQDTSGFSSRRYVLCDAELHTNMNYLEPSPSIQAIHCLETRLNNAPINSNTNHNSVQMEFVDGFAVAKWLKEKHPLDFEILASIPVKFQTFIHDMHFVNYQSILGLGRFKDVTDVRLNNRDMAPMEGPSSSIPKFYAAYKVFSEATRNPEYQFKTLLRPGDMIVFNNRRVLHGWKSFQPSGVSTYVESCYADLDEMIARYRFCIKRVQ